MGQQQQTAVAGSVLRRMILVLLAATLMATMMVLNALPAMAKNSGDQSSGPPIGNFNTHVIISHCQAEGQKSVVVGKEGPDRGGGSC